METHRIEIPEEFGGGYVEIRKRRSFQTKKEIDGHAMRVRRGLSATDMQEAVREGRQSDLMEVDSFGRAKAIIESAIVETSPSLVPEGLSVGQWVESDEMDADVGEFLLAEIEDFYTSRARSVEERKT